MKLINEWQKSRSDKEGFLEWVLYRKLSTKGILCLAFIAWGLFLIFGFNLVFMVNFFKIMLGLFIIIYAIELIIWFIKK